MHVCTALSNKDAAFRYVIQECSGYSRKQDNSSKTASNAVKRSRLTHNDFSISCMNSKPCNKPEGRAR